MFTCTCCSPARFYSSKKALYKHQRKYDAAYTDPRTRDAQERRDTYYADPHKCLTCETALAYEEVVAGRKDKFCNRSCAAQYNNSHGLIGRSRVLKPETTEKYSRVRVAKGCLHCHMPVATTANKYCSLACSAQHRFETTTVPRILAGEKHDPKTMKKYLVQERSWKCETCLNTEWLDDPIPLEMDHINGNPDDNRLENLRLLCPNCHAKTPTAKGKNRGNGRWVRRQRYAEGKSS